jgi:lysine-specific demethylase 8
MLNPAETVPIFDARELRTRDFNAQFYRAKKPMVVRNSIADWNTRPWSPDYLKEAVGPRQVHIKYNENGIFDYNNSAGTGEVVDRAMDFAAAVDLICSPAGRHHYIQQEPLHRAFGGLQKDIARPRLLDRWKLRLATNVWLGGSDCKSPLHFDWFDNLLVQVLGSKKATLFAPELSYGLYPAIGLKLPHCSLLNVFSPVDTTAHPLFAEAYHRRLEVMLHPGDTLYIPLKWWHAVESLDTSLSVNFWWAGLDSWQEIQRLAKLVSVHTLRRGLLGAKRLLMPRTT